MRVSEEFTSSLQVAKAPKHKGFSADYYSHSIVAVSKPLCSNGLRENNFPCHIISQSLF